MKLSSGIAVALLTMSLPGWAQDSGAGASFEGRARDAWIVGKVEMAYTLNEHLNPFDIDTDANAGVVTLSGTVDSDVDRDLAIEIAQGIDGVVEVNSQLAVGPQESGSEDAAAKADGGSRDFPSWFDDATTTAAVKTRLIANASTEGLQIDVDTRDDVVTLSGRVTTDEQKQLAGQIARNTSDVQEVRNLLVVDQS